MKQRQWQLIIIVCFLAITIHSQFTVLEKKELKNIEVEVGTIYRQPLPIVFHNFQFSQVASLYNQQTQLNSTVCRVKISNAGELTEVSSLPYNQSHNRMWMDDKIVTSFEQLKQLKTLNDIIYFHNVLYAFFTNNQLHAYSLDSSKGQLALKFTLNISHPEVIDDGRLVEVEGILLMLSSKMAVRVFEEGKYTVVENYNGTSNNIFDCEVINTTIYVGLGPKGIQIYKYTPSNNSLTFVKKASITLKDRFKEARFSIDELEIDEKTGSLYVLDFIEGLLEVPLSHLSQFTYIFSPDAKLLVSRCENLVVLDLNIYVTCPELIQIERSSGKIVQMWHNAFPPSSIQFKQERMYLFGRQDFAVFDLFGKVIDSYSLTVESEQSLMIDEYLVTFSKMGVIVQNISVQEQEFYCFAKDGEAAGEYLGLIQTEGLCQQYNGTKENQKKSDTICTIESPIHVLIKDSSRLDLSLELYALLGWLGFSVVFGTVMAIKHTLQTKKYRTLNEEEEEHDEDGSKRTALKEESKDDLQIGKGKEEEIVADPES